MSEKRVVKRKTHTKSRRGCFQCKQRHTKCNEARPRCANCVRLDISCTFPGVGQDNYSTSPQPSTVTADSPYNHPSSASSPGASRGTDLNLDDLKLLHHWVHSCADSMHHNKSVTSVICRKEYIELGFEYPWLLHGVLALSAVHKASFLLPADRQSLLFQADSHISQSLATYRLNLETSDPEIAVPMFILSSVLLTYNFGSAQLEKPEDPISELHHCFMLLQGIIFVVNPNWEHIMHNPIVLRITNMAQPETLDALDTLAAQDASSQEILRLKGLTELLLATSDKEACLVAIEELHHTCRRLRHTTPEDDEYSLLFLWPTRVSTRFFELFAARNPVACIIATHFVALLAQCRPIWWAVKWPQWLLTAAEKMLGATPDLLKWLVWPQQIIHAQASPMTTPGSTY